MSSGFGATAAPAATTGGFQLTPTAAYTPGAPINVQTGRGGATGTTSGAPFSYGFPPR